MGLIWIIAGAFVGILFGATIAHGSTALFGLFCGAGFGYLLWRLGDLARRLHEDGKRLAALEQTQLRAGVARSESRPKPDATLDLRDMTPPRTIPAASIDPPARGQSGQPADTSFDEFVAPASAPPPAPPVPGPRVIRPIFDEPPQARPAPPRNDVFSLITRWFTEGNVPVKVGMLVLFAGVAALLKYAADEGWFTFPIEFRLVGISLAAIAALVFAWRQRDSRRAFALSLQGGAIGILLLTVFAAFRLYHLLPAGAAFALMIVLVAGVCLLAVLQDALALAVLGVLAGFAAPILISTGSGNHVALFSYYAILNVAIFAIAWVRAWRILNLLGFAFTFVIGTYWGVNRYRPELFDSTEPFLLLFFSIYLAIPVLYAFKLGRERPDAVDASLVFANPLIAFSLQAALLDGDRTQLAISALALGVIYMVLSAALIRRLRVLGESFAVLALGFSTLSVPLALSARTTGCIFALEGAALIWLGLRQQRRLPRWIGLLLQLLAAGAFLIAFHPREVDSIALANGHFVSAILICLAALVSAWLYQRARAATGLGVLLYLWALCWWFGAWLVEIHRYAPDKQQFAAVLALFAISAWLAAEGARRWQRLALGLTTAILFWLLVPLSLLIEFSGRIFADGNLLAWAVFAIAGARSLACLRDSTPAATTHLGWLWVWPLVFALHLGEFGNDQALGTGWLLAMTSLPLLIIFLGNLVRPDWIAWPLAEDFSRYRGIALGSQAIVLGSVLGLSLILPGDSDPLAFVPLLNPLELFQLCAIALLAAWMRDADTPEAIGEHRAALLSFAGFLLITSATLRGVHHLGDIAWNEGLLRANLSQTSLTVVWSVLGVAGWVIGSRRSNRPLWLASAVLMAVVLIKLLLVDRQHLGNLFGIASFIAYGLLCTLIGYLAPAPPRNASTEEA